jgi:retron-type reverse transcriptase
VPARKVLIPKSGTSERRPLAIAAVRDRIVQAAMKIVLEPVFEADFAPCSFGYRPNARIARSAQSSRGRGLVRRSTAIS